MILPPVLLWIILGLVAVSAEIFAVLPGVGLLFVGLAGFSVAIVLATIENLTPVWQLIAFLGFVLLYASILWKPLKRWRMPSANSVPYNNMIGEKAVVVAADIYQGTVGKVTWSGTTMNAQLDNASTLEKVMVGQTVEITSVQGNTLIIK
jgi:membrane protein implicated in regulation of membrane protease activity